MVSCAAADAPASTPVATNAASNERDVMKPPKALPRDVFVSAREFALPAAQRRLSLERTPRDRPAMTLIMANRGAAPELKIVASLAYREGSLGPRPRLRFWREEVAPERPRHPAAPAFCLGRGLARRARIDCISRNPRAKPTHVLPSEQGARALGTKRSRAGEQSARALAARLGRRR